jgi:hypothetical protein
MNEFDRRVNDLSKSMVFLETFDIGTVQMIHSYVHTVKKCGYTSNICSGHMNGRESKKQKVTNSPQTCPQKAFVLLLNILYAYDILTIRPQRFHCQAVIEWLDVRKEIVYILINMIQTYMFCMNWLITNSSLIPYCYQDTIEVEDNCKTCLFGSFTFHSHFLSRNISTHFTAQILHEQYQKYQEIFNILVRANYAQGIDKIRWLPFINDNKYKALRKEGKDMYTEMINEDRKKYDVSFGSSFDAVKPCMNIILQYLL